MDTVQTMERSVKDRLARTFQLTDREKASLENHHVINYLIDAPKICAGKEWEETALRLTSVYFIERKNRDLYAAREKRFSQERLEAVKKQLTGVNGLCKSIIMKALTGLMYKDYFSDQKADRIVEKYNPINTGDMNYAKRYKKIVRFLEFWKGFTLFNFVGFFRKINDLAKKSHDFLILNGFWQH